MINVIIQFLLSFLIGVIVGLYVTLLFFRMDKAWKQTVLGVASIFTVDGVGRAYISYLSIPKDKISGILLVFIIGTLISAYVTFKKSCKLLKEQTGKNVLRVLDIVLGYHDYIKAYYESRKKDVDNDINMEELNAREAKLNRKEKSLKDFEDKLQEQKQNMLILELPEYGEVPITMGFIRTIPICVDNIYRFRRDVDELTDAICQNFTADKQKNSELLKAYFVGIGIYVSNDLFGLVTNIRTHFRILKDNAYVQYAVVLGNKMSMEAITDIPKGNSMIDKSFELKRSLIASLNPNSNYDTQTQWDDYMTITYYKITEEKSPFLSMGISIKSAETYKDILYFLNFYKIEECLQTYIGKVNSMCNIVETLKGE